MEIRNTDGKAKILAYYLPQFHPTEFNNKWYGKGFTEWINVGKAKPLFKGHYQPKVPADLGYYDLRIPEIAEQQAELAKEAGIFGFAYWHYWFGNGRKLLNMPAERMIASGKPDFPFCYAWANESWYKKLWDKNAGEDTLIMEQTYPGEEDIKQHFHYCLPAFRDKRYIRVEGKPLFMIYKPLLYPDMSGFMSLWNRMAVEERLSDGFCFMAQAHTMADYQQIKSLGFDFVSFSYAARLHVDHGIMHAINGLKWRINRLLGKPTCILDYKYVVNHMWKPKYDTREDVTPELIPHWDHSARSGKRGQIFVNDSPELWGRMIKTALEGVKHKRNKIIMLKSWNEWAEGNYMEPDLKYGKCYIETLGNLVDEIRE